MPIYADFMAVQAVWHGPDRTVRVELRNQGGRQLLDVIDRGRLVGEFTTVEGLADFLVDRYGLDFTDLVKD